MNSRLLQLFLAAAAGGILVYVLARTPASDPGGETAGTSGKQGTPAPVTSPPAKLSGAGTTPAKQHPESVADAAVRALRDEVLVSYGKVEDIGRQAAVVMTAKKELHELRRTPIDERSPETRRRILELERQRAQVLGVLPEVATFQNDPAQYSGFFTSMLQSAAGLSEDQTQNVNTYLRARSAEMIAAGLNEAKKPADAESFDAWEEKRDAFNSGTVKGVSSLLPPGEAERIGFNDKFMELLEQDFDRAE